MGSRRTLDIEARILFEDNHLLAIDKPAGLLSQGDVSGDPNVVDLLKSYRKRKENKPGEAYIGLVHRLDRPVSGVIVLAKTSKAASRLNRDWGTSQVEKLYRAAVRRAISGATVASEEAIEIDATRWTTWTDRLIKDHASNTVHVCRPGEMESKDSRMATLEIRSIGQRRDISELEIRLGTGRGHQIRVQLASRGLSIVGDSKYGSKKIYSDESGNPRLALHARRLVVPHPTLRKGLELTAEMPPAWPGTNDVSIRSGFRWIESEQGTDSAS